MLEKVYTLTLVLIKSKEVYWRYSINIYEYEEIIKINLIKKYNNFTVLLFLSIVYIC